MSKQIRWIVTVVFVWLVATIPLLAQEESSNIFAGRPTLWVAIIIGFITTGVTLVCAYRMRGGLIGTALNFMTGGMFLVVLGFLAVVVSWADADTQAFVHDVLFIIGYLLMLAAALQLRQMTN